MRKISKKEILQVVSIISKYDITDDEIIDRENNLAYSFAEELYYVTGIYNSACDWEVIDMTALENLKAVVESIDWEE